MMPRSNGSAAAIGHATVLASGATLTLNGDGSYTYDPTSSASFEAIQVGNTATDSFSYTVTDNHGATASNTITVDISVYDNGPVANTATVTQPPRAPPARSPATSASPRKRPTGGGRIRVAVTALNSSAAGIGNATVLTSGATAHPQRQRQHYGYDPTTRLRRSETIQVSTTATDTFTYTVTDNHDATASNTITRSTFRSPTTTVANAATVAASERRHRQPRSQHRPAAPPEETSEAGGSRRGHRAQQQRRQNIGNATVPRLRHHAHPQRQQRPLQLRPDHRLVVRDHPGRHHRHRHLHLHDATDNHRATASSTIYGRHFGHRQRRRGQRRHGRNLRRRRQPAHRHRQLLLGRDQRGGRIRRGHRAQRRRR